MAVVGRDEGPVVFLLCSQMPELFSDAFTLIALGGLPWGGAGSHACFLSHRKDSDHDREECRRLLRRGERRQRVLRPLAQAALALALDLQAGLEKYLPTGG